MIAGIIALASLSQELAKPQQLPTGKLITPVGKHASVGSYPLNMVLTKDGQFAVVTTVGYREFLSTVRVSDGTVVDRLQIQATGQEERGEPTPGLYYGLATDPITGVVYASRGAQDKVARYTVSPEGKISVTGAPIALPSAKDRSVPWHPAGIALSSDGKSLITINNQTDDTSKFKGAFSVIDVASGKETVHGATSGFPFAGALVTKGADTNRKLFVSSERDSCVDVFDAKTGTQITTLKTGAAPTGLLLTKSQKTLYVSNASSDTISVVDTNHDKIKATILLRPAVFRGLQGATPTGLALSPDESRLYVALQDMNAVAVIDTEKSSLVGYIPTGWLPTSIVATSKGLLIASGKGVKAQNPNAEAVMMPGLKKPDHYIQNLIDGTVTWMKTPTKAELRTWTPTVLANNKVAAGLDSASIAGFTNPGIKHVIYIVKENRTYDNVLGDLPQGNGDPKQALFPRAVTPNLHALAERFVLLDNFHVCAEVSQDGWQWSMAGMLSAYASRNTPYNYSGRGRNYDTEGSNNNIAVDLIDIPDVARPSGGFIWEACAKGNVSYRNYGAFAQFSDPEDKRYDKQLFGRGKATKKLLMGHTSEDFSQYDNDYPDSDGYTLENFSWSAMKKKYGSGNYVSRFSAWKNEFDGFVKTGDLPAFQLIRFGNDHTQGTRKGKPTPQSAVADNDFAVAELVDAVSHSPYWKDTAIFVLEDDAQNGYDHVDAHRSTAYVISPYVKRSLVDSRFYNTDSVLRTMELLIGLPPMNQYDAVAAPLDIFASTMVNEEPFTAMKEDPSVLCRINGVTAYRSKDSEKLSPVAEESASDEDLNDILWGAIKGARAARPRVVNPWRVSGVGSSD